MPAVLSRPLQGLPAASGDFPQPAQVVPFPADHGLVRGRVPVAIDRGWNSDRSVSGSSASSSTCTSAPCRLMNPAARESLALPGLTGSAYSRTWLAISVTLRTSSQQSTLSMKSRSMSSPDGSKSPA
jgi:hypothetical protein